MLAFNRVGNKEITFEELVADLSVQELHDLTDEMIDQMLTLIDGCTDSDVTFQPVNRSTLVRTIPMPPTAPRWGLPGPWAM